MQDMNEGICRWLPNLGRGIPLRQKHCIPGPKHHQPQGTPGSGHDNKTRGGGRSGRFPIPKMSHNFICCCKRRILVVNHNHQHYQDHSTITKATRHTSLGFWKIFCMDAILAIYHSVVSHKKTKLKHQNPEPEILKRSCPLKKNTLLKWIKANKKMHFFFKFVDQTKEQRQMK